jgi:uncharacterized membrane protein
MEAIEILRLILGSIFVLFLPGLAWSFVFFKRDEIDVIERVALSFGLSIALVPLTVFWLNYLFGIRITLLNVSLIIILLTAIPLTILHLRNKGLSISIGNLRL